MSVSELIHPAAAAGHLRFTSALRRLDPGASGSSERPPDPVDFFRAAHGGADSLGATSAQLHAAATSPTERPRWLPVVAQDGIAHLPGLGYVHADGPRGRAPITVPLDPIEPELRLSEHVQVIRYDLPVTTMCLTAATGRPTQTVSATAARCATTAGEAWTTLRQLAPHVTDLLELSLRHVVLFTDPDCNSFAEPTCYGAAFCNVALGDSAAYLVEDLVHQGGHNVLMAAAARPATWFSVDPGTVSVETSHHGRTLYVLWHGTVTEALMVEVLGRWWDTSEPSDPTRHEVAGRYAFALRRFATDVATLAAHRSELSRGGEELLDVMTAELLDHRLRHGAWVNRVELSGQGYNFSYTAFADQNPDLAAAGTGAPAVPPGRPA